MFGGIPKGPIKYFQEFARLIFDILICLYYRNFQPNLRQKKSGENAKIISKRIPQMNCQRDF